MATKAEESVQESLLPQVPPDDNDTQGKYPSKSVRKYRK